ncbi:FG-GAP-like repeat-containing protein [Hymenobacter sediminicola]|uniref:VCBS repeat-containing protein n=1 Tax=Hymenobacter sediminicola TaxID=2761579 RepID=A0A7G7W4B5_9BACT|nr:FG-GAP-like repeat-containing protein [Hymenobacter sediminicola]QNH61208.1 VCBS repeat-containing protein [Hymenobacter sediminicola]
MIIASTFVFARRISNPVSRVVRSARWGGLTAFLLLGQAGHGQNTVVSRAPARNATAAVRTAPVSATFSQAIASASAGNPRVFSSQRQGRRTGSVSGGGSRTLSFSPSYTLLPGELLSVSVPPTLLTASGGTPVTRQVYQFRAATGGTGRGYFTDSTTIGQAGTRNVLLGDVDGDGDLDMVSNAGLFSARIRLNNGTGQFGAGSSVVVAGDPAGLALADVDNDGDLDLLATDAQNATTAICLNNGSGEFIGSVFGAQNVPVGQRPVSVATGDIDADGDLDFVTANESGNSASISFNNGSGVFSAVTTVAVGQNPNTVTLADVDDDGDLDLLTTNGTSNTVSLRLNNGLGVFSGSGSVAVGTAPSDLALADLDADGDLDLLVTNASSGTVSLRLNSGGGIFGGTTELALSAGSTPSALSIGDVDADSDLDFVVAQGTGGAVSTFKNNGTATFTVQNTPLVVAGLQSSGVTLGDVDGDLDLDVVTVDGGTSTVVLGRNGQAPAPPRILSFAPGSAPMGSLVTLTGTDFTSASAVTFNGVPATSFTVLSASKLTVTVPAGATSGLLTVTTPLGVATSTTPFQLTLGIISALPARNALNVSRDANPTLTFGQSLAPATSTGVRVFGSRLGGRKAGTATTSGATFTFDPTQDFAPGEVVSVTVPGTVQSIGGLQAQKQVLQFTAAAGGTGQANFTALPSAPVGYNPIQVVLADVTGDGTLDLLTMLAYEMTVQVGLGNGRFGAADTLVQFSNFLDPNGISPVDFDADGDLDLLATFQTPSQGKVTTTWVNNGSGTFTRRQTLTTGSSEGPAVGDVDGDGDLDFVVSASVGSTTEIFTGINDGNGNFTLRALATGYASSEASYLALGDLDNDGDLDLVAGQNAISSLRIRLNDGLGNFGSPTEIMTGAYTEALQIADIDGDQDLDIIVSLFNSYSGNSNAVRIYLNNGQAVFSAGQVIPMGNNYSPSLVTGDVDADGDLDLAICGVGSNSLGIYRNDGAGTFASLSTLQGGWVAYGLTLGDVDGDSDLDLVNVTANGQTLDVFLNQAPAPTTLSFTPSTGPVGTSVIVTGTNFINVSQVEFNGLRATYVVDSPTQLTAVVPTGARTGPIRVVTGGGSITSTAVFTVLVPTPPVVTSYSPTRNAPGIPRTAPVVVSFSQNITAATATNLRVFGSQLRGQRPGTLTGAGTSTLTFRPTQNFAAGEQVSVSIPSSLLGPLGGSTVPQVLQFTIAASGTGRGQFVSRPVVATGAAPLEVAVADFNNDDHLDLLTVNTNSSTLSLRFGWGGGNFSGTTEVAATGVIRSVAVGDVDGDGDLDFAVGSFNTANTVAMYINNGSGQFAQTYAVPVAGSVYSLVLADINSDGSLDLVASSAMGWLSLRFNDGQGRFSGTTDLPATVECYGVNAGDLDNDGDLDLVAIIGSTPTAVTYFNDGEGNFTRSGFYALGNNNTLWQGKVRMGDLDRDGDLDFIVSTGPGSISQVVQLLNNGNGTFAPAQQLTLNYSSHDAALADVDADGDLDLLSINSSTYKIDVSLNNGSATFTRGSTITLSGDARALAIGDLDRDGDLDLVTAVTGNNSAGIYLNGGTVLKATAASAPSAELEGYPNPAHGFFTLRLAPELARNAVQLVLLDALGRQVQAHPLSRLPAHGETEVDVHSLSPGLYLLRVQLRDGRQLTQNMMLE